jgi:hypothetical protein
VRIEPDVAVLAQELDREPFLALAFVLPAPHGGRERFGQIVGKPAARGADHAHARDPGFLGQFGNSGPGLSGDLNNDGLVNTQDLTRFLGVFGTPCP